jgi:hypothetical protein
MSASVASKQTAKDWFGRRTPAYETLVEGGQFNSRSLIKRGRCFTSE